MKDDTNKQRDFVFLVAVRSYCSVNYIGEYEKQLLVKLNVLLVTLVEANSLIFGNFQNFTVRIKISVTLVMASGKFRPNIQ